MEEHLYTLKDGTIVSNEYARCRIVGWLRSHDIPLEERKALAQATVEDPFYAQCLVTYLCHVALEIWQLSWKQQWEDKQIQSEIPPWKSSHSAKILDSSHHPYLHKGGIADVRSDEGEYLWIYCPGTTEPYITIPKADVLPVPNFLDQDPDELIESLDEDQALVGALVDQGFTLDRCLTESDRDTWISFYQSNLGEAFGILHKGPTDGDPVTLEDELETYWIDTPWPTTVTVATKL